MNDKAVAPYEEQYVFELDDDLKEIAEKELRETEESRNHALAALREWINKNPKIVKCRFDSSFLLRFLRTKKYSLPIVQETLERYLLLRQVYDNEVFQNLSLRDKNINELVDLGFALPLPKRDRLGRRVVLNRPGVFDLQKHDARDVLRVFSLTAETLIENEQNHISGFVHLGDASGMSLQYLALFTPREALRLVKNGESLVPMRHKLGVGYNVAPGLKIAIDFGLSLLSEKMKNRVKFVTNLENCTDIEKSILPKELGGEMPMKEMIDLWKKEIEANQNFINLNDEMRVNLNLFTPKEREGYVNARNCGDVPEDWSFSSIQGSFRKLEVD